MRELRNEMRGFFAPLRMTMLFIGLKSSGGADVDDAEAEFLYLFVAEAVNGF